MIFDDYKLINISRYMKSQWLDYVNEFKFNNENLVPDFLNTNFKDLLFDLKHSKNRKFLPNGWVPYEIFFLVEKNTNFILGAINVRYELNDFLLKIAGNIGYGIRPSQRGKNLATIMLFLTLKLLQKKAKHNKIYKYLLTCDERNIASKRVILKNQGIFENKIYDIENDRYVERYWIHLKR